MYEYNDPNPRKSIKDVILQLLFIVVFVFILVWLFPTKGYLEKNKTQTSNVSMDINLDPLYNQIYTQNLNTMKDAAKSYYTTERLPKNIGDKVSMTLEDMVNKNLLLPLYDSNNEQCDMEESYVEVTNKDTEYVLKANLKCGSNDNYLLVHMGCYNYCKEDICENTSTVQTSVGKSIPVTNTGTKPSVTPPTSSVTTPSQVVNNNTTTVNNNNTTINNNNNTTIVNPSPTPPSKPSEPSKPTNPSKPSTPSTETTTYYEYREVTTEIKTTKTKMCKYHPVTSKTENIYTLGYTSSSNIRNEYNYPLAVELPDDAYDPYIKSVQAGYDNFNYSEYRNLKRDGRIYNYNRNDSNSGVTNMPSSLSNYSLKSEHIDDIWIYGYANTRGLRLKELSKNTYKIDYSFILDSTAINRSATRNSITPYNANVGNIYFVPIKFVIGYDSVSSKIKTDECDNLTALESQHIVSRYTDTDEEKVKKYGSYKWTTNKNLKNVEYTGRTKQVVTNK